MDLVCFICSLSHYVFKMCSSVMVSVLLARSLKGLENGTGWHPKHMFVISNRFACRQQVTYAVFQLL